MSQAPGRTSRSRACAPAASSMAFDPRGRFSWRYGSLCRMSGTGTASTDGSDDCADPCRPSIQATSARANSGTSLHGTPADVNSGPPSETTAVSLFFDIKTLHRFDRGGLTIARPVSLPNSRIPLREPPCPGRQVGEGVSPTLDAERSLTVQRFDFKSNNAGAVVLKHSTLAAGDRWASIYCGRRRTIASKLNRGDFKDVLNRED
jgi:hypothetical protein